MDRVFHWIDQICKGGGAAAALALFAMSIITFYEVVMRYALDRPTIWVHEVGGYMLVVIGMLAAAYTLMHERHVRVDLVLLRLPRRVQAYLNLVTYTLALAFFFAFLAYYGWRMFLEAATQGSKNMFGILETPYWLTYWMVPVGALLVCLQLLSRVFHTLSWLRGRRSSLPTEERG